MAYFLAIDRIYLDVIVGEYSDSVDEHEVVFGFRKRFCLRYIDCLHESQGLHPPVRVYNSLLHQPLACSDHKGSFQLPNQHFFDLNPQGVVVDVDVGAGAVLTAFLSALPYWATMPVPNAIGLPAQPAPHLS